MKKLLILLTLLSYTLNAAEPIQVCRVYYGWDFNFYCVGGYMFVTFESAPNGRGITQFLGTDGKPVTCSCGGR